MLLPAKHRLTKGRFYEMPSSADNDSPQRAEGSQPLHYALHWVYGEPNGEGQNGNSGLNVVSHIADFLIGASCLRMKGIWRHNVNFSTIESAEIEIRQQAARDAR